MAPLSACWHHAHDGKPWDSITVKNLRQRLARLFESHGQYAAAREVAREQLEKNLLPAEKFLVQLGLEAANAELSNIGAQEDCEIAELERELARVCCLCGKQLPLGPRTLGATSGKCAACRKGEG